MARTPASLLGKLGLAMSAVWVFLAGATAALAVDIREVSSPSGVNAWLVEDYSTPIISVAMSFRGGSVQDPQGKEGMANLLSALFDEGAGPYDSAAFQARIESLGVNLGFSAGRDAMAGELRTLRDDREEAFELLRLSLNELRFEADAVRRMREQLKSGLQRIANDPQTEAGEALRASLFGAHPYGRRTRGTLESLDAIGREDLVAHFRKLFARDNLTIAVVGAISAEETGLMLEQVFAGLPARAELTPVAEARVAFGDRIEVDSPAPQTSVILAYPGVTRDDPDFFAAFLATHILGGGTFSSRIYQEVRERRGLAYSAGADLATLAHAAYVTATASTRADRSADTLAVMREQFRKLAAEGPTAHELESAKQYVIGSYAINTLDNSTNIARALIGIAIQGLGIDYIERRAGLIGAVTLEQVKAAAARLFSAEPTVAIVGPRNS